jgi:hypothetical protein
MSILVMMLLSVGESAQATAVPPTWDGTVRAVIQDHCVACHRSGGPAPFPLVTYEDVSRRAQFVVAVTTQGIMPPWSPSNHGVALKDSRGLSKANRSILKAWYEAGAPVGSSKSPAVVTPPSGIRRDLVVAMPEVWSMPAEGGENWGRRERDKWSFVLPIKNTQLLRVQAIEHVTTAPTAMHAVSYLTDATDAPAWQDARAAGPGHYMTGDIRDTPSGVMGTTGVGQRVGRLPDGYHWPIVPEASLVMETHFRPTGRVETVQDAVVLELSNNAQSRPVRAINLMQRSVDLPAGATETFYDSVTLPESVDLLGITPRAMGVCTEIQVSADLPGEGVVRLLDLPDYDPHWRMMYQLDSPRYLPAGTVLEVSWTVANTQDNVRNPFLPIDRLSMAKRTGALSLLFHVAAEDDDADRLLMSWHAELMQDRLRPSH